MKFSVLFCHRESVRRNITPNLKPGTYIVETEISFRPVIRQDTKKPWFINANSGEEAFAVLKASFGNFPLATANLAVEAYHG